MADRPEVLVNGEILGGWKDLSVSRSVQGGAGGFGFSRSFSDQEGVFARLAPRSECEIRVGAKTILKGLIGPTSGSHDGQRHSVSITGRSKTGRIIDCSVVHPSGSWKNRTVLEIAREICEPFDVSVSAEVDVGLPFKEWKLQPGETGFETIERAAKHRRVIPMDDGIGGLSLVHGGSGGRASEALQLGVNIRGLNWSRDDDDRYSHYIVRGQNTGGDWSKPEQTAAPRGEALDPAITDYRPFIIISDEPGDSAAYKERAEHEMKVRAARSRSATATVRGWLQSSGDPWIPNQLVRVLDPWAALDQDMLISAVAYSMDTRSVARLSLTLPDAFTPELPKADQAGAVWG